MDYLADALVDIGKALFKTPCTVMKILISCLPIIPLDINSDQEIRDFMKFREKFMEMVKPEVEGG